MVMSWLCYLCRQASIIPSYVVITDTTDSSGGLRVQFYVRGMRGGIIPASAIVAAIQVSVLLPMPWQLEQWSEYNYNEHLQSCL